MSEGSRGPSSPRPRRRTGFPGDAYPVCGCDACDSTWEHEADGLERLVRAVVTGNYREAISFREGDPWLAFALESPDGRSSGGIRAQGMS
ncbi:DUF6226 family protein [Microbacterium kunmingense]|uniref:DUF6226 family protein n=1 Tax=Microbacterium kunmingense TaxID=2915939 RepID=UPI003D725BD5